MATCDDARAPETVRVMGTRVGDARHTLTAYLPLVQSHRTVDNLRKNRRIAVFYGRVTDYRAVQIKGALVTLRSTDASDRERQVRYLRDFTEACAKIGLSPSLMGRLAFWPSIAVEMEVDELFAQTPGPQAGTPWR